MLCRLRAHHGRELVTPPADLSAPGRVFHLIGSAVIVSGVHTCLHVLKLCKPSITQVEHHVADNALDKVRLEVEIRIEAIIVVFEAGYVRIKGRKDTRLRDGSATRLAVLWV